MNIVGLPALVDTYENYIWVIHNDHNAWVVDPGEAQQVLDYLQQQQLTLAGILITHRHHDHIGGINDLLQTYPSTPVFGPENCPTVTNICKENDQVCLTDELQLKVLETPGHTEDHIAFYNDLYLFCGDTLFTGGCGRILGGTVEQFSDSILKLRKLNDDTQFFSAHEYTNSNLAFAKLVEPNNQALAERINNTKINYPAIHQGAQSTLAEEKATNPFMRFDLATVKSQLLERGAEDTPASLFKTLRDWKDQFDRGQ